MNNPDLARPSYSAAALFGRLLMGAIFVWSGAGKLLAPAATMAGFAKLGSPCRQWRLPSPFWLNSA